jgi:hypothetical protein
MHKSMTKRSKYRRANRFEVQHLYIVEDIFDEDRMMEVVVRKWWTLSLVFGVGWNDQGVNIK